MKLFKYSDHEEYIKAQKEGIYNHRSVSDNVNYEWIQKSEVEFLQKDVIEPHFRERNHSPKHGICHGAKLGKENVWFQDVTKFEWIGTDLVIESDEKMNLINWDFHEIKPEWKEKFDVVYSNSLDHSYDPEKALKRWFQCLNNNGICIIEHSDNDTYNNETDPFGATFDEYKKLIEKCNGVVLKTPKLFSNRHKQYLIIENKK